VDDAPPFTLSVIIPARNEQDCLGACLRSLVDQQEDGWRLGADWEILVINDGSTDRTREIAAGFPGVIVLDAPALAKGWTGKANAAWTGANAARGGWFLFTDADTIHAPGHLRLALIEADRHNAGMLSYSPRQIVSSFAQRAVMPLIFSELAMTYSPAKVNDPARHVAAANGQFLLVRRDVYEKIGGHEAVKSAILEDVELALLAKRRKLGLRFRFAPEAVSAHMYRSFGAMWEGWTKNLALLFNNAPTLAAMRLLQLFVLVAVPLLIWFFWSQMHQVNRSVSGVLGPQVAIAALLLVWLRALWGLYSRVSKSNFPFRDCVLAPLGIPLYAALLWQSWFRHNVVRQVVWKGREVKTARR
jgi:glycosyltransferase involved in cell wall biosynthesis